MPRRPPTTPKPPASNWRPSWAAREVVSRLRKEFERPGWLKLERGQIAQSVTPLRSSA